MECCPFIAVHDVSDVLGTYFRWNVIIHVRKFLEVHSIKLPFVCGVNLATVLT